MNLKFLIPVVLLAALTGCASTTSTAANDPVGAGVQGGLAQGKADGSYPLTEVQYVYPNWPELHKAP